MREFVKYLSPFVVILFLISFTLNKNETNKCEINLSYTVNFKSDSLKNKLIGLKWAMSYLGANLPRGSFNAAITNTTNNSFTINFSKLGFNPEALGVIYQLTDSLKKSSEYAFKKNIDIGEFIALTIGVSETYYKITGVKKTLSEFKKHYAFNNNLKFAVLNSTVAFHNRIVYLSDDSIINKQAYIAEESDGLILDKKFTAEVFETFNIMENGQLRFAVYNKNGDLISSSKNSLGKAGKPAKCLWCHEIVISPLFKETPDVPNFISKKQFSDIVNTRMHNLNTYRKTLNSDIDFTKTQEHTQMELLYISYMEPSLKRLSQEWNMPIETLKKLLKHKQLHKHEEFKFFGDLYNRNDNLKMAPYALNSIPLSVREEIEK